MTLSAAIVSKRRTLARPAQNARATWASRESCIITLESEALVRGQGEAAPLPGFSPDTLSSCAEALSDLKLHEIPERLLPEQDPTVELRRASEQISAELPAARAALEAALLDLWSRTRGVPAWALLASPQKGPPARSLSALLSDEPETALAYAITAHRRGIETFKIKIGRPEAFARELVAVQGLRAELGPSVRLRLDANQAFSAARAAECLPPFSSANLEFIEEPCPPGELAALDDLGLPVALDESLATGATPRPGVRAVILKPTLLGGVTGCSALAHAARGVGAHVVLSHAFEGPLGLALSATLSLTIGSEAVAHGLDPEGAQIEAQHLPWYDGRAICAWTQPGFGLQEQA